MHAHIHIYKGFIFSHIQPFAYYDVSSLWRLFIKSYYFLIKKIQPQTTRPSWLGQMVGCVVEAHGSRFESYRQLNNLIYPMLVVAGTISTPRFESP